MTKVISFQNALTIAEGYKKHLLLGNGFSIACVPTIFTYTSLFNRADFSDIPEATEVFKRLKTEDFELVINALENSGDIVTVYNSKLGKTASLMKKQAHLLKEKLIETIAQNHPATPNLIPDNEFDACTKFLCHFLNESGKVYSLNYDLLLYWTLMYGYEKKLLTVEPNDGFGKEVEIEGEDVNVSDYVTWQGETNAHVQNIHYLHGALHVFDKGSVIEKFTWANTGIPLIEQIRAALSENRFPLFVTEGVSNKKMEKITHSGYLYHSYKSFSTTMLGGPRTKVCLFTYGVSFSENDKHIIKKIRKGKVNHLFVGLFGESDSKDNLQIIKTAEQLKRQRQNSPLEVTYYDSSTANVWGK